tara:strand:- start:315 stop:548 length:234 start_codon:yes stop_codon:yes gene_type:complete
MKENKFTKSLKEMMNKNYLGKMEEEEAMMMKKHKEEADMMHMKHKEEKEKMEELKKKMKSEGPGHYDAEAPYHYDKM